MQLPAAAEANALDKAASVDTVTLKLQAHDSGAQLRAAATPTQRPRTRSSHSAGRVPAHGSVLLTVTSPRQALVDATSTITATRLPRRSRALGIGGPF
jgi:hypothetical protein